ncbi:MAG: hypothetical protein IIY54_07280 [Ruminococcus sp.]|nr:hypothetical protein [Ruminococcus sp.]
MVIYQKYTAENGDKRVLAYSNQRFKITRDGQKWASADDFEWQNRIYEETDEPVEYDGEELTVSDTLGMLKELGVNTDD